jgi:hypothetical protein
MKTTPSFKKKQLPQPVIVRIDLLESFVGPDLLVKICRRILISLFTRASAARTGTRRVRNASSVVQPAIDDTVENNNLVRKPIFVDGLVEKRIKKKQTKPNQTKPNRIITLVMSEERML